MILFLYSTFITSAIAVSPDDCFMINERFLPHPVSDEILKHHCERLMISAFKREWTSYLSRALVLNDVVPFTVLTEDPFIDLNRRSLFLDYLEYIADTSSCSTVECISLELNRKIWNVRSPSIVFEPAPPNKLNSYSINQTWNRGNGSCTSMSVFLITGLRLLGVPARIAGVPHWNLGEDKCPHGDASEACGNHNWVEVFVPNKGWSFLDQRRPDQIVLPLNHSWFFPEWTKGVAKTNNGNHSIYAASFAPVSELDNQIYPVGSKVTAASHFPLAWDFQNYSVHAWDVSEAYRTHDVSNIYLSK